MSDDDRRISGRATFVLDPEEISQLDELSLTSVMRQVTDKPEQECSEKALTTPQATAVSGDTTINKLLRSQNSTADPPSEHEQQSTPEEEDLLSAELLFPEETDDDKAV